MPRNRSVAIDRLEAVARSEEAEVSRGAGSASAAGPGGFRGWTGADNGGGNRPVKSAVVSRLEQRLEMRERASARDGAEKVAPELTANIRRKIQFLQDCDWWVMFCCSRYCTCTSARVGVAVSMESRSLDKRWYCRR